MNIDIEQIKNIQQRFSIIHQRLQAILVDCSNVHSIQDGHQQLMNNLHSSLQKIDNIETYLLNSMQAYESLEYDLQNRANVMTSDKQWTSDKFKFQHDIRFKNNSNFDLDERLMIGIGAVGSMSFSIYQTTNHSALGNVNVQTNINVGHIAVSGKGTGIILKDGKINPSLNVDVEARGSLFQAQVQAGYKNKVFGAQGDVQVDVGTAHAKAKAIISKEEVSLKADYGVAAIRGKAHGRISLFGFHLDATVEGEALAFGAGAEFSKGKDYVEIGGKFSLFAGLGFKIRIGRD